jgi:2,3-bisphosphoglycerate-dependent phosphoglycerate mutase
MLAVTPPGGSSSSQVTRAMRSLEAAFLIGVEGVTEIWLVRHADAYGLEVDSADPPLSAAGRVQAAKLSERVRRIEPSAIYSSPYRRALETAHAITDDVSVDERLIEVALEIDEDASLEFKEDPAAVVARMSAAIDDILARHHGQRVVAVGHGGAITACLTDVLQLEPGRLRMLPYYTSVSVVRVLDGRRMVGALGDVAHLE